MSGIDAAGWTSPVNLSSTVVIIAIVAVGFWLMMRVVRAGFSLLALVVLWLIAAWLFGLPPVGGEGVLS
jgi:hypothetical protein